MIYSCPICFARGEFKFITQHKSNVYKCLNKKCGHFWTPEYTKEKLLFERNSNLELESNNNLKIFFQRNKNLLKLFLNEIPKKNKYKFLDFGSGCAHVSRSFKNILKDRVDMFCIESNPKCKEYYSNWGLISVDKINKIKYKIDFIFIIEVIEHLEDPYQILNSLKEILANDGKIFISTPPGYDIQSKTNAFDEKTHIQFFTKESLNLLLEKVGLEKINYKYYPQLYPKKDYKAHFALFLKIELKKILFLKFSFKEFLKNFIKNFFDIKKSNKINLIYPFHLVGFTKKKVK